MENHKNEIKNTQANRIGIMVIGAIIAIALLAIISFIFNGLWPGNFLWGLVLVFLYFYIRVKCDKKWDASKLKSFFKEKVTTWKCVTAIATSIGAIVLVKHFTDDMITTWFIASLILIADVWFSSSVDGYLNDLNNNQKPKSWLYESVFSILIMPPMGIVATTYANLSTKRYENSDFEGSYRASILAYRWASIGVIIGMMCWVLFIRSLTFTVY